MNIYIYGNQNFKKDIKGELSRTLIDYKLEGKGLIQEVQSLSTLKELIEDNSDDIFLIDDAKIIKENLINSKIKFLKPKDGIEQEYLKNKGIEDFSVDSISDISKYILKKMKDLNLDDESDEGTQIHDSITNIVNDAYESENLEEDLDEHYELSDDLKELLSQDDNEIEEENEIINKDEQMIENNENQITQTQPNESMKSLEDIEEYINLEDITSLDELSEDDILNVFSGKEIKPKVAKKIQNKAKEMSIKLDNPNDIKEFLSKLLESKALEITVKIKE
ncbi:hypothetical protein [Arcobacter sp. F2176]|uniref:hypothetical protein n=1 Tax=Arcobacter sp. F2176 TaxID=2044511 RepID=UPI00100AD286|nr:hypothetical protein [Arcobacter sp. F2176]RXJ82250.1 hypothetical protein CRU95_01990 [Arcobacter sp. F2176]